MKLPRNPKGMWDAGQSGRRFSACDMPLLRSMRDIYAKMLSDVRAIDWTAEGPGMPEAAQTVMRDLVDRKRAVTRALDKLERTPRGWRP